MYKNKREAINSWFVGIYAGASFLLTFVLMYLLHSLVYNGLLANSDKLPHIPCDVDRRFLWWSASRLYVGGCGIQTQNLKLYDMCYETLDPRWLYGGLAFIALLSILLGFSFKYTWLTHTKPTKYIFWLTVGAYAVLPVVFRWVVSPRIEPLFLSPVYCILLLVITGACKFNPQQSLSPRDPLFAQKYEMLSKMLVQYFLIVFAIAGVLTVQFLFGFVKSIIGEFSALTPSEVAVIAWPYFFVIGCYTTVGSVGLTWLAVEFHHKYRDLLEY